MWPSDISTYSFLCAKSALESGEALSGQSRILWKDVRHMLKVSHQQCSATVTQHVNEKLLLEGAKPTLVCSCDVQEVLCYTDSRKPGTTGKTIADDLLRLSGCSLQVTHLTYLGDVMDSCGSVMVVSNAVTGSQIRTHPSSKLMRSELSSNRSSCRG